MTTLFEIPATIESVIWKPGEVSQSIHFSAVTDEWSTPQDVFDTLDTEFGFTLDACATDVNTKCARYYTTAEDGLRQPWSGVVWVNPSYGNGITDWLAKGYTASRNGVTSVFLLPSNTDTRWFHLYVCAADEIRFIKGRLKFGGAPYNAPHASMIVVFRGKETAL